MSPDNSNEAVHNKTWIMVWAAIYDSKYSLPPIIRPPLASPKGGLISEGL